jgi:hypothetical protein
MAIRSSIFRSEHSFPLHLGVDLNETHSIGTEWKMVNELPTIPKWISDFLARPINKDAPGSFIRTGLLRTYANTLNSWNLMTFVRELVQNMLDFFNATQDASGMNTSACYIDEGNFCIDITILNHSNNGGGTIKFTTENGNVVIIIGQKWPGGGRLSEKDLYLGSDKKIGVWGRTKGLLP